METSHDHESSDNVFNFESDHLALRGNREYSTILRTIALLEAQKIQLHSDIEQIILSKNKYLKDPSGFVNDIFENKFVPPKYMCILPIPDVGQASTEMMGDNEIESLENADIKVRGRVFDQSKPETFNQLWTCDEQRRLEQLLIEYPVEPVEMRRFTKIALALGNRTPQQVASRVQKFFKKLHSVGMPVPGRIPKNKKGILPKSKHFYRNIYRQSTFFPAHNVPVNIPEDDSFNMNIFGNNNFMSDYKPAMPTEKESMTYKKNVLNILQVIRSKKSSSSPDQTTMNIDEKCDNCMDSSCSESRLVCNTCCCCVNLCGDCIVHQILSKTFVHMNHDIVFNKVEE